MNLYLRLLWIWLRARLKPPIRIGDTIEMRLRVWPNDIDVIGHMNNGRYMTIIDLALIEYFTRTGFLKVIVRKGWRPMLGGSMISFRRGLKPFRRYTLRFAVSCWDDRWNYMRFEFVRDGRAMAVGHAKGAVVGAEGIVNTAETHAALGIDERSPAVPASIAAWIEADRMIRA
jgi:acyl-CoA thioesterase FadM